MKSFIVKLKHGKLKWCVLCAGKGGRYQICRYFHWFQIKMKTLYLNLGQLLGYLVGMKILKGVEATERAETKCHPTRHDWCLIYKPLRFRPVRWRGGLVVSMLDYESWGREFKSHRGQELLTSKKAASESTQL